MKILYVCADTGIPVLGRKGAAVHVREMVAAFVRAGHQVALAAPVTNRSPWEEPASPEAMLIHLPLGAEAVATLQAVKAFHERLGAKGTLAGDLRRMLASEEMTAALLHRFRDEPPHFIYERAALFSTVGVSLAEALDVPLLLELNAPLTAEQAAYRGTGAGELAAQAERWVLERADAVLTVSGPLRDQVVAQGVAPERVHVFPNGVDPAVFCPRPRDVRTRTRWGLGEGPVLGFVGGLRPWHGVAALPALLERLTPLFPTLQLVIAGDGPLRRELESGIRELSLGQHVVFTGRLAHGEIAPLIREFDIALAPYPPLAHDFYFSPLKLFEYMGCGVAVVAAAAGQIAEVVQDGETGLLYPPGDAEALAAACARLLDDPELRRRLGQAAADEVHRCYTWDRNTARAVELARSLTTAPKEVIPDGLCERRLGDRERSGS